jgi:hypothetical protein
MIAAKAGVGTKQNVLEPNQLLVHVFNLANWLRGASNSGYGGDVLRIDGGYDWGAGGVVGGRLGSLHGHDSLCNARRYLFSNMSKGGHGAVDKRSAEESSLPLTQNKKVTGETDFRPHISGGGA